MILYLDTSSLVKLYLEEAASADVADLVGSAEVTGTSLIAYAEARAAFARRFRENAFSSKDYKRLRSQFESDMILFFKMHHSAKKWISLCKVDRISLFASKGKSP